jgi:hypothetical protein
MGKEFETRHTDHAEFQLKPGQSLVVNLFEGLSEFGLDRIVAEFNKDGKSVKVAANGYGSFEFSKRRKDANSALADFILQNPSLKTALIDYIGGKFWGQFNWGELAKLNENKKFVRRINRKLRKLVSEFEEKASKELNNLPGTPRKVKSGKR